MPSLISHSKFSSLRSYRSVWLVAIIVGLLQACYAIGFICRTSFIVEGKRFFCLFDDAMISMRYAANWAQGQGLVWNPGEYVEGYTNLGWTMIMGLCHLLKLPPEHTCLLVQLLGIPILWTCTLLTVLLSRACRLLPVAASCAVVMAGTYYHLVYFSLMGMETGLATCLVTAALISAVYSMRSGQGRAAPILWFAPAVLVRLDTSIFLAWIFVLLMLTTRSGRWRLFVAMFVVVAVVSLHMLWRHHYYGEWLPNTYYLKATGWPLIHRIIPGTKQSAFTIVKLIIPILLAFAAIFSRFRNWHCLLFGTFGLALVFRQR